MNDRYDDIINLPHHESPTRPRMAAIDRAAQFSAFAALVGFDAALKESARQTGEQIILTESAQEELDEKLRRLSMILNRNPQVSVTYFQDDLYKRGGAYVTVSGELVKIDPVNRYLTLADESKIDMDKLLSVDSAELPDEPEQYA